LRAGRWMRRHRPWVAGAVSLLAAALPLLTILFVRSQSAREKLEVEQGKTKEALAAKQVVLDRQKVFLSEEARTYCEIGERDFNQGNYRKSLNWMLRAYETAPVEDERRLKYLRLIGGRGYSLPDVVLPHGSPVTAAAFSPDGRLIITGGKDGSAWLWEAA